MIRTLIDVEMAVMNGKYETAYYLLGQLKFANMPNFFSEMRTKVGQKLFEIHGEKS